MENRINDSRTWFAEHKDKYTSLVLEPMTELVKALTPALLTIDPDFICTPKVGKTISRIFRDTRFSRNKSIYRDNAWCSFMRDKKLYDGLPGFYVDVNPGGFSYGCGYYKTSADSLAAIRGMIRSDDRDAVAALRAYAEQDVFTLADEKYKRSRNEDQPPEKREWLDQKSISLNRDSGDLGLLFSDGLADMIAEDFMKLAPVYKFFMRAEAMRPKE